MDVDAVAMSTGSGHNSPSDWAARRSAARPCSSAVGIVRSAASPGSPPTGVSASESDDESPDR